MVDGRTTDNNGQRTDEGACLYYKLTNEPKGSDELKRYIYLSVTLCYKSRSAESRSCIVEKNSAWSVPGDSMYPGDRFKCMISRTAVSSDNRLRRHISISIAVHTF